MRRISCAWVVWQRRSVTAKGFTRTRLPSLVFRSKTAGILLLPRAPAAGVVGRHGVADELRLGREVHDLAHLEGELDVHLLHVAGELVEGDLDRALLELLGSSARVSARSLELKAAGATTLYQFFAFHLSFVRRAAWRARARAMGCSGHLLLYKFSQGPELGIGSVFGYACFCNTHDTIHVRRLW